MRGKKLTKITKMMLDIMFYCGIVVEVTFPLMLRYVAEHYLSEISAVYVPMLIVFLISGICGLVIILQLRKMVKTVLEQNCFVHENVRSLKIMNKMSFIITALFITKIFFYPTPATCILILTFFIAGVFSEVLSFVFDEAVRYKEENDLTI